MMKVISNDDMETSIEKHSLEGRNERDLILLKYPQPSVVCEDSIFQKRPNRC